MTVDSTHPRGLGRPGLADEYLDLLGAGDEYGAVELAVGPVIRWRRRVAGDSVPA